MTNQRISCDFDGCINLNDNEYPFPHSPNLYLINWLKEQQREGSRLILNTVREGLVLKIAVAFCEYHGLYFDRINDNLIEDILKWNVNPRKISADIYIDDRNWKGRIE